MTTAWNGLADRPEKKAGAIRALTDEPPHE